MGQKIHPRGFRLGQVFTWNSHWFAGSKEYRVLLYEDIKLREMLFQRLKIAGLASVEIERSINKIKIVLNVSRPGIVIGRGGSGLEQLKKFIEEFLRNHEFPSLGSHIKTDTTKIKVDLVVEPVKEPNLSAHLVATNIADQLIRRLPHKRISHQALERVSAAGAKGVRIVLAGRIAGAEIARREKYQMGTVPLSTIREDVDFSSVAARTKSGYIGVKVWICRKS
ncbi:MAG: 30S ribosomal protein S3 [bacterium]|nr:30S ribosomal protein S3 [bacterium]